MTTANPFEVLRPILNSSVQKELDALTKLLDAFPNASIRDIAGEVANLRKEVLTLRSKVSGGLTEIVQRISKGIGQLSATEESEVCASLKKLAVADLKKLGNEFQLELSGSKADILKCLEVWIRSGGETKPTAKAVKEREHLEQLVFRAKPLYELSTPDSAAELLSIVSTVEKLTAAQIKLFADEIGITVNGKKAQMCNQLKSVIQRRSVSHVQTHS